MADDRNASVDATPWASLLRRHRANWVASLAGDLPVTEVAAGADPREQLEGGTSTVVWLDEYPGNGDAHGLDQALRTAAGAGRSLVVGLPADAAGAAERVARRLADDLGGYTVVQRLAAGSLIGQDGEHGAEAVHYLVCARVDSEAPVAAGSMIDAHAAPLMSGYVSFLEQANRSLAEANTRLARERLGVHDAAAGALEPKIAALQRELEQQRRIAEENRQNMLNAEAALAAPRYRAVDALRALAFRVPGLGTLLRIRSSLIQRRQRRS